MTKERIEIIRQSLIPFVKKKLLEINYEGLGNLDAKEFEKDLNEVLDLAIKELDIVEEFERAQIITGGRLNGRAFAYKCGLEAGKRKVDEIKQVVDAWNNDASNSFSDMCKINEIIKQE